MQNQKATIKFGQEIKARRKKLGLTQKQLGDKVDYLVQNVWAVEQGKGMSDREKHKFADALDCDLEIKLIPIK